MKRLLMSVFIALLICGCWRPSFAAQQALEGDWVGTLTFQEKPDLINTHFKAEGNSINGSVDYPLQKQMNLALSKISLVASRVHLEWQGRSGTTVFDGYLKDGMISGDVQQGETRGSLQLAQVAEVNPESYDHYDGLYELDHNKLILIRRSQSGLTYLDFSSGRIGMLFPSSASTFFAGPAFLIPTPIELKISFIKNGQDEVVGLVWRPRNAPEQRARKLKFRREEVTFRNGDVTLSGTLVLPNTKGPHPAVVRIHGAGPADRSNSAEEFYAYHGIAFLSYDKRGVGKSTGDWREARVEDLAGDTLAGVQLLKSRKDINPKQIGLGGGSEGGWVAPVVAARDKDVAFILLVAGPALSFADELANEAEDSLRANGFSGNDLQAALAFRKMINDMIRSGEALTDAGWEKIQAAAQKVKGEKWFPYVRPATQRDWRQKKQFLMLSFDPQPLWEKTTLPVLALYGGLDRNVPAPKNVAALEKSLKKAGNRDYTVLVFPTANHEGMEAVKGFLDDEETAHLSRFVPGYFDTAINWILKRVVVPK